MISAASLASAGPRPQPRHQELGRGLVSRPRLGGCAGWAIPCALPRRAVLLRCGAEKAAQSRDLFTSGSRFSTFDSLQSRCCNAGQGGQLRLRQPAQYTPVSWEALNRYIHHTFYGFSKCLHHSSQFVHLRSEGAVFPRVDSRRRNARQPSKVGHGHRGFTQSRESAWGESTQDASAHVMTSMLMVLNHRARPRNTVVQ